MKVLIIKNNQNKNQMYNKIQIKYQKNILLRKKFKE